MSEKILVPSLGESVTEATVSKWLKNKGDKILSDEPLVELETDKVNVEVPSPSNGILKEISVSEGQTVNVGALLGTISESNQKAGNDIQEVKEYSPPTKKKETKKVAIKKDDITTKVEPLYLDKQQSNEEPLILSEPFNEKKNQLKKRVLFLPQLEKL